MHDSLLCLVHFEVDYKSLSCFLYFCYMWSRFSSMRMQLVFTCIFAASHTFLVHMEHKNVTTTYIFAASHLFLVHKEHEAQCICYLMHISYSFFTWRIGSAGGSDGASWASDGATHLHAHVPFLTHIFGADGAYIAAGGSDGTIYIWDCKTKNMVSALHHGHRWSVGLRACTESMMRNVWMYWITAWQVYNVICREFVHSVCRDIRYSLSRCITYHITSLSTYQVLSLWMHRILSL